MKKLILILMLTSLLGSGCDSADTQNTGKQPPKTAATAGQEDCQAYFTEVVEVCRDSFYEGLKVSCHTAFISAEMAHSQKEGNLFNDPNGKVSASTIGDALCRSNIRSLRKKIKKAKIEPKKDWGPKCTSFLKKLDSNCVSPVAQGKFDKSCSSVLSRVNSLKRNKSPEDLCGSLGTLIKG